MIPLLLRCHLPPLTSDIPRIEMGVLSCPTPTHSRMLPEERLQAFVLYRACALTHGTLLSYGFQRLESMQEDVNHSFYHAKSVNLITAKIRHAN